MSISFALDSLTIFGLFFLFFGCQSGYKQPDWIYIFIVKGRGTEYGEPNGKWDLVCNIFLVRLVGFVFLDSLFLVVLIFCTSSLSYTTNQNRFSTVIVLQRFNQSVLEAPELDDWITSISCRFVIQQSLDSDMFQ